MTDELKKLVRTISSDDNAKFFPDKYVQAIQAIINRSVAEAVIKELESLPHSYDYIDSGGEYIDSYGTQAIKERLAVLQATLTEQKQK